MARFERQAIQAILASENCEYFDEYRRIMFDLVGDVGYFKAPLIQEQEAGGRLTSAVLLGVGGTPTSPEIRDRICSTMLLSAWQGLMRDASRRVRLVIPCNTLSSLGSYLYEAVRDPSRLHRILRRENSEGYVLEQVIDTISTTRIDIFTVPSVTLAATADVAQGGSRLFLGTRTAVELYRREAALRGEDSVIESLAADEYVLVDAAIGASISRDDKRIADIRQEISEQIVEPRRRASRKPLMVIEACTDLDMSLGVSSREMFARSLVRDAYTGLAALDA